MALARYLLGLTLAFIAILPVVIAASGWRRRLLPRWSGPPALLVDVILVLTVVVLTGELLGTIGVFRLVPVVASLALVGLGAGLLARRLNRRSTVEDGGPDREASSMSVVSATRNAPAGLFAALALTSVVVADWSTRTVDALHHGMSTPDTIWYHMPFAARFAQTGSITALHYVDFHSSIAFYPENGELLHALGILYLGNDFLSPVLNMGWLAFMLLASWCVGRPFGVGPVTLAGGAVLMATPGLVATQPGGAYTDVAGFGLLAAAMAILVNSDLPSRSGGGPDARLPATCVAALATGLALGTKFTFVIPAVALTIGVWAIAPRGARARHGCMWLLLVLLTGGFWYVRNVRAIGNPLPSAIHLGPIRLAGPPGLSPASSVATFLFKWSNWRQFFLPGFRESLGPAWWAVLGSVVAGLVLVVRMPRRSTHRMLALVGIAAGIGFVFTPQPLTVPVLYPNVPYDFVYNLRYSFAALLIGLLLLPIARATNSDRVQWGLLCVYGSMVLVTQFDSTIWPTSFFAQQFAPAIRGMDAWLGALGGILTFGIGSLMILHRRDWLGRRPPPVTILVGGVVVVAITFGLQQLYQRDRYQHTLPLASLYAWAQHVEHSRIAITGYFSNDTYPLDGPDESNYVQVLGASQPRGEFSPITNCPEFRRVVDIGHYRDLVTITNGDVNDAHAGGSRETRWTSQDPKARLIHRWVVRDYVFKEMALSVFRLDGELDPTTCRSE